MWVGEPLQEERGLCSKRSVKRKVTKTLRARETTSARVDLVSPFASCPGTVKSRLSSPVSPLHLSLCARSGSTEHGKHYHGHCHVTSFVSCLLLFQVSCVSCRVVSWRLLMSCGSLSHLRVFVIHVFMVFSFVLILVVSVVLSLVLLLEVYLVMSLVLSVLGK